MTYIFIIRGVKSTFLHLWQESASISMHFVVNKEEEREIASKCVCSRKHFCLMGIWVSWKKNACRHGQELHYELHPNPLKGIVSLSIGAGGFGTNVNCVKLGAPGTWWDQTPWQCPQTAEKPLGEGCTHSIVSYKSMPSHSAVSMTFSLFEMRVSQNIQGTFKKL